MCWIYCVFITDFIEKATWTLAILLLVFSLLSTPKKAGSSDENETEGSLLKNKVQNSVGTPAAAPVQQTAPTTTP